MTPGEIFEEGMKAPSRTREDCKNRPLRRFSTVLWMALAVEEDDIVGKM